ncbi:uncharacterized protein LOC117649605 [Thrips palmi]|uniref:Uncharacterized protein LOC117649605 n=1 Tax=Thrips palmi TaxID=161013 RepID=A0A6P8ZTJ3_THRPL|nr:uncharacterized protein LOC117649605 [Thrips palmi]
MGIQFLKVSNMSKPTPNAATPSAAAPPAAQGGQGVQGGVQGVQGVQGIQGVQGAKGVQGVLGGIHGGVHGNAQGSVPRCGHWGGLQGCGLGAPKPRTIAKRVSNRAKRVYVMQGRPLLSRVYRFFGLRHGTMLIAIHDLMWSSFVVFMLVLATAHTREMSRMVENDVQAQMAERAGAAVDGEKHHQQHHAGQAGQAGQPALPDTRSFYERYIEAAMSQAMSQAQFSKEMHENEVKLNNGLHIATAMTVVMVFGISMAGIDMIASMMLLAGAALHVRQLMMPWLSLRLLEMMLLVGSTVVSMFCYDHGLIFFKVLFTVCLIIFVVFYHWLVAYSLHEHLCRLERTGLVHHTRPSHHRHGDSVTTLTAATVVTHSSGHQIPVHTCDAPLCPNAGRIYNNHLFNPSSKAYLVPVVDCRHTCGDTTGLLSAAIGQPMSAPPATLAPKDELSRPLLTVSFSAYRSVMSRSPPVRNMCRMAVIARCDLKKKKGMSRLPRKSCGKAALCYTFKCVISERY